MIESTGKLVIVILLWVALLVTALAVVYVTFDVRRKTQVLASLGDQTQALRVETGQLLLEESTLAAYARVEKIATETLGMRVPTGHEIVVVNTP